MKVQHLIFTAILFVVFSCKSKKEIIEEPVQVSEAEKVEITMSKGSCFGRCPVYTISLNQQGYSVFHGKRFSDRKGWFEKTFTKKEYEKVLSAFANSDFESFQDVYESEIPDLPLVTISYKKGEGETKTVKGKVERPEALIKLQALLEELAETDEGWTIKENTEEEEKDEPKETTLYNEIIIEPQKSMVLPPWFKQQKELYGIRLLKKIAPNLNYWLITYDTSKFKPEEMLQILLDDPKIKHAEFNKKVNIRKEE